MVYGGIGDAGANALDFSASWTTDSDLDRVAGMATLERLNLAQTRVTDAGLERLRPLRRVRELDLYFSEFFTDDGVAMLRDWKQLERLNLRGTRVTSRVFEPISQMTALRTLDVSYSQIDDAGVELLAELPRLERLAIGGTRIGVVALSSLKLLPELKHLDVSGMQRVDSGHWGLTLNAAVLAELGALEQLISLNLSGAVLNDIGADKPGLKEEQRQSLDGLERLAGLSRLEKLDLSRTPVNLSVCARYESCRACMSCDWVWHENRRFRRAGTGRMEEPASGTVGGNSDNGRRNRAIARGAAGFTTYRRVVKDNHYVHSQLPEGFRGERAICTRDFVQKLYESRVSRGISGYAA